MDAVSQHLTQAAENASTQSLQQQKEALAVVLNKFTAHDVFQSSPPIRVAYCERTRHFEQLMDLAVPPFLAQFPAPRGPWDKELTEFSESLLDLFGRGILRLEGLFSGNSRRERKWMLYLLSFVRHMNSWGHHTIETEQGVPTPTQLADRAVDVAVNLLSSLGSEILDAQKSPKPWHRFRSVLQELLGCCKELFDTSSRTFPFEIKPMHRDDTIGELNPFDSNGNTISKTSIMIESDREAEDLATTILHIICRSFTLPLACRSFISDLTHISVILACDSVQVLLDKQPWVNTSSATKTSTSIIHRCLESLVFLLEDRSIFTSASSAPVLICRCIAIRSSMAAQSDSDGLEIGKLVLRGLTSLPPDSVPSVFALQFAETLSSETWSAEGAALRSAIHIYLAKCFAALPDTIIGNIRDHLKNMESGGPQLTSLKALYSYNVSQAEPVVTEPTLGKRKRRETWRDGLKQALELAINSKSKFWQDAVTFDDERFLEHICNAVHTTISQEQSEPSLITKLSQSEALLQAMRILDRASISEEAPPLPSELLVATMFACATQLLKEGQVQSPHLYRTVFSCISLAVKHGIPAGEETRHVVNFAAQGMRHTDRTVRIGAGKILIAYCNVYQSEDFKNPKNCGTIIAVLMDLTQNGDQGTRETAIVTLAVIGRNSHDAILGQVVHSLISQWAQDSSVIKALAFTQLSDIAKRRGKNAFSFLYPFLPQIIIYATANLVDSPTILNELGRFLCRSPSELLGFTLQYSLPSLVTTCSREEVLLVARIVGRSVAALLVDKIVYILKDIFLLPDDNDVEEALAFLTETVAEAANAKAGSVGTQALVNSSLASLLAELVVVLGDENPKTAFMAEKALGRVERTTAIVKQHGKTARDLATFLKPHILGIMTHLNEVLQEVQGKKSPADKRQVVRSIGTLISKIGSPISAIAPQIMAAMQSLLQFEDFAEVTLNTWHVFITELTFRDIGPYIGSTSAAFVKGWMTFSPTCREIAKQILNYLIIDNSDNLGDVLGDFVSLEAIPELAAAHEKLGRFRRGMPDIVQLEGLLQRCSSDNSTVAFLSLLELKQFLAFKSAIIQSWAAGDVFDPIIGTIVQVLLSSASRDGDTLRDVRLAAYECIGLLGALDPDRFEPRADQTSMTVVNNFIDEGEAVTFALHVIRNLLVGAFRSTSDLRYQSHLAYAIQELLKFCSFTPDLVKGGPGNAVPIKVRNRWESLPKHMLDTVTPLLEGKFSHEAISNARFQHPIYEYSTSYREWVQQWASFLITRVSGTQAKTVFGSFRLAVRSQDAEVARYLISHLVLHVLISGSNDDREGITEEIITILKAQVDGSSDDRRLLSAQTIFSVMDHLSSWIRLARQHASRRKADVRRGRSTLNSSDGLDEASVLVQSVIDCVNPELMATAAFQCKAYARALMTLEQLIITRQKEGLGEDALQPHYERLHLIYAQLDEPDGMEGVSTKVALPSLDHQIREHESIGRWTSAQSCWEVKLQQCPDDIELHLGLLRCLRNLGHQDTLLTHIKGVVARHPEWAFRLSGLHAEGTWMIGDWEGLAEVLKRSDELSPEITIAKLLLALRSRDSAATSAAFRAARVSLGAPLSSGGKQSYRRSYESIINLHLVNELEMIHSAAVSLSMLRKPTQSTSKTMSRLKQGLAARLGLTQPTFRAREPILSMRRTGLGLSAISQVHAKTEIGRAWLASAKIARKAGYSQTAYSATLQARQWEAPYAYIESSKLVRDGGDGLRALQELNTMLTLSIQNPNSMDLSGDARFAEDFEDQKLRAKALLLRARWMHEAERYDKDIITKRFMEPSVAFEDWESPYYHFGHYFDELVKVAASRDKDSITGATHTHEAVCRMYGKALSHGSKYIYQTMPRMLTVWLDPAENPKVLEAQNAKSSNLPSDQQVATAIVYQQSINTRIESLYHKLPAYQWLTAFPQIVSRISHANNTVVPLVKNLIVLVLRAYPQQGLWHFTSVVKSKSPQRAKRANEVLDAVKSLPNEHPNSTSQLINQWSILTTEFLHLCDFEVKSASEVLDMTKSFPKLFKLAPIPLILPLQESLTVIMPSTSSLAAKGNHQSFKPNAPTFQRFVQEIQVMQSLVKPKRVTVQGDDGQMYGFLCKPKDDLRKDARLMDFFAMINKLLKANSESRRRQLRIRTYAVLPINESSGLIEWVPNTIGMRAILIKLYEAQGFGAIFKTGVQAILDKGREGGPERAAEAFTKQILPMYKPVFHEWFLATFPEPTAWLTSRLVYARTYAVMSMVGAILGLGDRHGENILFDSNTGETMHVDFNCLFEKGKTFDIPEMIPFRLTQNVVDGFGVMGVEGVYRKSCEITMQLLRDNKDSLVSVLEAFVHDPLVEWEAERTQKERELRSSHKKGIPKRGALSPTELVRVPALRELASKHLTPVERKLRGFQGARKQGEKPLATPHYVEKLVKEATDPANLGMLYIGWCAFL